jgi:hypothetical protein
MPKRSFAIEAGAPKRLDISWGGLWRNFIVTFDGRQVGQVETGRQLRKGARFILPDGSQLQAQLVWAGLTELRLLRNGVPLPGSATDPEQLVKVAVTIINFAAAVNAGLGICSLFFPVDFLVQPGASGIPFIVFGVFFGALGYMVDVKRSTLALSIAIALLAADGVGLLLTATDAGQPPSFIGLLSRIIFIFLMVRGLRALRLLQGR